MGRNLSPALCQKLANLEKEANSRKSAMKELTSYVKNLDSNAIPLFLTQVSATKDRGSSTGEYTISLYEVLARVHGPNIVAHIDNIMSTIIKTLTTSGGSFPLQQACSKVGPAIARYGIEPTTPEEKKRGIIHSLCKPLSDSLLCTQESLSCGGALCLKALVDCDNWRFASDDIVNEVCLKVATALEEKPTQTNSHMGLVISLAKHNSLVVEAYARLLTRDGVRILNCESGEVNSRKRLTAIQMVHSLMKYLDIRSIISELDIIIKEMEKCRSGSGQMPYVRGAAFEALQTAKRLLPEKGSMIYSSVVSPTSLSGSPESRTLDSFAGYESLADSPVSTTQGSCDIMNHVRKNIYRKLWNRENSRTSASSELDEGYDNERVCANGFLGSLSSRTPTPERTHSQINVDNTKIFRSPSSTKYGWSSVMRYNQKGHSHNTQLRDVCEVFYIDSESVSSTEDVARKNDGDIFSNVLEGSGNESHNHKLAKSSTRRVPRVFSLVFIIALIVFAIFVLVFRVRDNGDSRTLVPT